MVARKTGTATVVAKVKSEKYVCKVKVVSYEYRYQGTPAKYAYKHFYFDANGTLVLIIWDTEDIGD